MKDPSIDQLPIEELFATLLRREFGETFAHIPTEEADASTTLLALAFHFTRPELKPAKRQTLILCSFLGADESAAEQAAILGLGLKRHEWAQTYALERLSSGALPEKSELPARIQLLQEALMGLFQRSYDLPDTERSLRREVCGIALRITELLVERYQEYSSTRALLALLCFDTARLSSKLTSGGDLVLFKEHDRSSWDAVLIEEGLHHLAVSAQEETLGAFHLQASIAAQHCIAPTWAETNWEALQALYLALSRLNSQKKTCLNQVVVNYHLLGPLGAINELNSLMEEKHFARSSIAQATLAAWLLERGQRSLAQRHFQLAQRLAEGDHELALLQEEAAALSELN